MAAPGAIRKRGAVASKSRATAPPAFTAPEPVPVVDVAELSAAAASPAATLPPPPASTDLYRVDDRGRTIGVEFLMRELEKDRVDNARNHERAHSKHATHDAEAHLAVVHYIKRLSVRLDKGEWS